MISQREAVKQLYTDEVFKSKFWEDSEIFNENTPLLKENIENCLKKFTNYCNVYDSFFEYQRDCPNKDYPQVVGLKGEGMDHWIAVRFDGKHYYFIDSSGAPKDIYFINGIPDLPPKSKIIATEQGFIRQSPKANSCGLYALFFCLGYELKNNGYDFWADFAPKTIAYSPITVSTFAETYDNFDIGYFLYSNDMNMYNLFQQINKN